jgi:hypothetical protein
MATAAVAYSSPIYAEDVRYEYLDHTADVQLHACEPSILCGIEIIGILAECNSQLQP